MTKLCCPNQGNVKTIRSEC